MITEMLWEIDAVRFGEFKLTSGKTSNVYVDLRKIPSYPKVFRYVVSEVVKKIKEIDFDVICGVAVGGLPLAAAIAYELGKPMIYVRKERKEHGTEKLIEGDWEEGSRALLVDDVATTGGSLMAAAEALRGHGLRIEKALVVVDRLEGAREALASMDIELLSLITLRDLLSLREVKPWGSETGT
ncbi:MAG: orotate phosphoribosyltransferase [Nitrososphaeria archaeon]|nr:orotate phosphoribosyltransferase [Nitrososphaeria archaeon]